MNKAYKEGYWAAYNGKDRSTCPYPLWEPTSTEWYSGYDSYQPEKDSDHPPF